MPKISNANDEQKEAFSAALRAAMASAGITEVTDLARRGQAVGIDRHGQTFSTWVHGSEPSRGEVLALEVLLGVEPGHLSRHLGWVPVGVDPSVTIEQMILAEPDLTAAQKQALLTLLESMRKP